MNPRDSIHILLKRNDKFCECLNVQSSFTGADPGEDTLLVLFLCVFKLEKVVRTLWSKIQT